MAAVLRTRECLVTCMAPADLDCAPVTESPKHRRTRGLPSGRKISAPRIIESFLFSLWGFRKPTAEGSTSESDCCLTAYPEKRDSISTPSRNRSNIQNERQIAPASPPSLCQKGFSTNIRPHKLSCFLFQYDTFQQSILED